MHAPFEIWICIAEYLTPKDLLKISLGNKDLYKMLWWSPMIWRIYLTRDWTGFNKNIFRIFERYHDLTHPQIRYQEVHEKWLDFAHTSGKIIGLVKFRDRNTSTIVIDCKYCHWHHPIKPPDHIPTIIPLLLNIDFFRINECLHHKLYRDRLKDDWEYTKTQLKKEKMHQLLRQKILALREHRRTPPPKKKLNHFPRKCPKLPKNQNRRHCKHRCANRRF